MTIPRRDFCGQRVTATMMELRGQPGEFIDFVAHGGTVDIEKSGKHVATMIPANSDGDHTKILSDGSIRGQVPLTFRRNLGNGGYGD
jgi:antitoxin (DNA-binding transcriptional repressor) of toxin-antitoxin stability system